MSCVFVHFHFSYLLLLKNGTFDQNDCFGEKKKKKEAHVRMVFNVKLFTKPEVLLNKHRRLFSIKKPDFCFSECVSCVFVIVRVLALKPVCSVIVSTRGQCLRERNKLAAFPCSTAGNVLVFM